MIGEDGFIDELSDLGPSPLTPHGRDCVRTILRSFAAHVQHQSEQDAKNLHWTLDNIYTIARRELNRLQPYVTPDTLAIERWGHILRLCEKAGCQPRGVLRDNGGDVLIDDEARLP